VALLDLAHHALAPAVHALEAAQHQTAAEHNLRPATCMTVAARTNTGSAHSTSNKRMTHRAM
jgi:hypothetical protein